jgi:hypothetical protein
MTSNSQSAHLVSHETNQLFIDNNSWALFFDKFLLPTQFHNYDTQVKWNCHEPRFPASLTCGHKQTGSKGLFFMPYFAISWCFENFIFFLVMYGVCCFIVYRTMIQGTVVQNVFCFLSVAH